MTPCRASVSRASAAKTQQGGVKMKLYQWQTEALQRWEENQYQGIVNVVTGAGKTVFALAAMEHLQKKYPELRVRIVVPTIPLALQWKQRLLHSAPSEEFRPGFWGGERKDDHFRRVMIYIINSARQMLSRHIIKEFALNHPVLLICDECHHYQSPENRKIFSFLNTNGWNRSLYTCLGLSATPFSTSDDAFLKMALGREIYHYSFSTAVKDGTISPYIVGEISVSFLGPELQKYSELSAKIGILQAKLLKEHPSFALLTKKEFMRAVTALAKKADMDPSDTAAAFLLLTYQRKEISVLAQARIRCCLELITQLSDNDRILVFCERISQARQIARELSVRLGSQIGLYHSQMTRQGRTNVMNAFRDHSIRILVSCRCLDEGIDVPDANIGIVMSSSSVPRQRIQRLGRIIRRSEGKDAACLYYLYIRESADDPSYLEGLQDHPSFSLRYYSAENTFSNDVYEYVASDLLSRSEQNWKNPDKIRELRSCILEGHVRADHLLPEQVQKQNAALAAGQHEQNYWNTMRAIGHAFSE